MAPKSLPLDLTSVFLQAVASQGKITFEHVETALKDCRLGKKVVMGFLKDRVECQRGELCKFLCKFFIQEQPRQGRECVLDCKFSHWNCYLRDCQACTNFVLTSSPVLVIMQVLFQSDRCDSFGF